jgi:HTH-type transcriptional regulator, transcriptional repressor of NAD biosynthesis genes
VRRGFLLGKFMPPHTGHEFMSRVAASLCDELTILVCSLPDDPIPGYKRHEWMKALFPCSRVLHHDHPAPQEPSQHPDFWRIWQGICKSAHPEPIDCVFGSENYVVRLAAELGAEPAIIDRERIGFPVSGTAVRNHPYRHWPMIPGPVRSWYQKRVVMFGAESTGKTSLGAELARAFGTVLVPEYGRTYDAARQGKPWTARDFDLIRERQTAMRKAAAWNAGPILVEDTDAYLTDVWQAILMGTPLTVSSNIEPADLYLFLGPDLPWENDGTRYWEDPQARSGFDRLCSKVLSTIRANQAQISGSWDERLASCRTSISLHFPDALVHAPG